MNAPAMGFLADGVPLLHYVTSFTAKWKHAVAQDSVVLRKAKHCRVQIGRKRNSLKELPRPVERMQEARGELRESRVIFYNQ